MMVYSVSGSADKLADVSEPITTDILHEMVGTWVYDLDFIDEYLRRGAEVQRLWCGYGWPEDEIKRRGDYLRANAAQKGPPLVWHIRDLGEGSLELRTENNDNGSKTKVISGCRKQKNQAYVCQQSQDSEPLTFRFDGGLLSVMLRLTPDMMSCQLRSTSPNEIWMTAIRFKRGDE
jgi:hypothetical protein